MSKITTTAHTTLTTHKRVHCVALRRLDLNRMTEFFAHPLDAKLSVSESAILACASWLGRHARPGEGALQLHVNGRALQGKSAIALRGRRARKETQHWVQCALSDEAVNALRTVAKRCKRHMRSDGLPSLAVTFAMVAQAPPRAPWLFKGLVSEAASKAWVRALHERMREGKLQGPRPAALGFCWRSLEHLVASANALAKAPQALSKIPN